MINNTMNEKKPNQEKIESLPKSKPNEHGGFYFSSKLKIFDPNTNEVLVQKRGDI
jgi:hypothetical protein